MDIAKYSAIAEFMGGWFHQDFDLEGGTVSEVMNSFRVMTPIADQMKLKSEIGRFLDEHPDDLDEAFEATFRPDVIPSALSGSTRAFLEEVAYCLR